MVKISKISSRHSQTSLVQDPMVGYAKKKKIEKFVVYIENGSFE